MLWKRLPLLCLLLASKVSRTTPREAEKKQLGKLNRNDHLKDFRSSSMVTPSIVVPTAPSAMPSSTPSYLPTIRARQPTAAPTTQDLENCFIDLVTADTDGSGAIERDEFLGFINIHGQRFCWQQTELTLRQLAIYNRLACLCLENDPNDVACCLLDNAKLPLTNAMNTDERTEAQVEFLTIVCQDVEGTIENLCSGTSRD